MVDSHVYGRWAVSLNMVKKHSFVYVFLLLKDMFYDLNMKHWRNLFYSWDLINYKLVYLNIGSARIIIWIAPWRVNVYDIYGRLFVPLEKKEKSDLFLGFLLWTMLSFNGQIWNEWKHLETLNWGVETVQN